MITLRPCTLKQAKLFVADHHRHSEIPTGALWAIAALHDDDLIGIAIVGRPVSRELQRRGYGEVTRLCVVESAQKGTPSRLLRAAWRAWAAMGGQALVTYTLARESGSSLRGAGFTMIGCVPARHWSSKSRPRRERAIEREDKLRWELRA